MFSLTSQARYLPNSVKADLTCCVYWAVVGGKYNYSQTKGNFCNI